MHIGLAFPTTEIKDPGAVREFAEGAESLGFDHLTALDHVLGTRAGQREGRDAYTPDTHIHEPLTLFAYLAGVTRSIRFVTSVLIISQRQAVLVARQAAEIDALSGGRMRLGIGLGSNPVEAKGVGSDFHTRGARVEEQIAVMRALWTQRVVTFHGRWHDIEESGLTVLPVQRPIPLWMGGGSSDRSLERIGRVADGWIAAGGERSRTEKQLTAIRAASRAAGRAPDAVEIQGRMALAGADREAWLKGLEQWRELGASYLTVNTSRAGFTTPTEHLQLAERFLNDVGREGLS